MFAFTRKILHLSTSPPSREMREKGVYELPTVQMLEFARLVEFRAQPSMDEVRKRAGSIADIAETSGARKVIAEVPGFMISALEYEMSVRGIAVVYPWGAVRRYLVETDVEDVFKAKARFQVDGFVETGLRS
jgi:hypothetical protein